MLKTPLKCHSDGQKCYSFLIFNLSQLFPNKLTRTIKVYLPPDF